MKIMNTAAFAEIRAFASSITPVDQRYVQQASRHLDQLTKPIGSLGHLEAVAAQVVAIRSGTLELPLQKAVYVFAADHGVTHAGVSAYPPEVTVQMVRNFLAGGAAINVLARQCDAELTVVDVGVDADLDDAQWLRKAKIRRGSRNFLDEPAMTEEECASSLDLGIALADEAKARGKHLVAVGEMGIGNTTSASAIAVMLTQRKPAEVTGRGTGLDDAGRNRKLNVIRRALRKHFPDGQNSEPLEILRRVGGLEIAAMTGFYLGAARNRQVIVCDGFISTAAAAVAYAIAPAVKDYLLAGHCSEEPGHRYLLRTIGITPLLRLNMRLGEATGAVLAMPLIESALRLYTEMATFSSAGVSGAGA
jgi:nicotinate-nucleotide--dimethylbenzimidazole phosphoribosyltransferase